MQSTEIPATEKQIAFAMKLIDERYDCANDDNAAEARLAAIEFVECADKKSISTYIDALLKLPKVATAKPAAAPSDLEDGYYAVDYQGKLCFYRLKTTPAGKQYVNRFRSDFMDKVFFAEAMAVRDEIRKDAAAARDRFAAKTVRCYICAHRLTDETSMALGIGPECRSK
jgi:Family of unknown function (DUF6011)